MSTVSYDRAPSDWDTDEPLPRRPRRQFLNRRSAALLALTACAAGFYAGVRIEKSDVNGSSTVGLSGAPGAGGGTGARSAPGARTSGFPAFAAGGAGFGGAGASVGTVSSISGKTLVLTETSGNAVKVRLTSATKVTKSLPVARRAIRPGDTLIVRGVANSSGTTVAGTVTDSGASAASASSSTSTGSGSGAGGGSGVGSLFSGG